MHTDQPLDVTLIPPPTSHPLNSFCINTSHSHISADAGVHSLPGSDASFFFCFFFLGVVRGRLRRWRRGWAASLFFFWKCGFLIRRHILWSWKTARSVTHFIWMPSDVATALVLHTVWRFCYRRFIFMFRVILFFSIIQWWWWQLFSGRKGKLVPIWVVNLLVFLTISQKKSVKTRGLCQTCGGGWHLDPRSVAVSGCQSVAVMAHLRCCAPIDQVQVIRQSPWGGGIPRGVIE